MSKERYVREYDWIIDNNKRNTNESLIVYDEEWNTLDDICDLLNQKENRIAELEEQLKNMFTPKFKKGQEVWFVNNKTQIAPIKVIIGDIHFCWQSKNKFFYDGNMRLNFYECMPENELFNTQEEALAKLEELKGE